MSAKQFDDQLELIRQDALKILEDKNFRNFIKTKLPHLSLAFQQYIDNPDYITMSELGDCILAYCVVANGKIKPASVDHLMRQIYFLDEMKNVWLM